MFKNYMMPLALMCLGLPSFTQNCSYLAYEPFDYLSNSPLNNKEGGSGWLFPWLVQNDDEVIPGFQINDGATLFNYQDLQTIGQFASGGRVYYTAGRRLDTNSAGPFEAYVSANELAIGSQPDTVLWMSALLRKDQNNSEWVYAGLHDNQLPWCDGCTNEKLEFGYFGSNSEVSGQKRWTLRVRDEYFVSSVPITVGSPSFFVIRMAFEANNISIHFYINPASLGTNTPQPELTHTTNPMRFRSLVAYLGNNPGNGAIDEIRMANSYTCVAPDQTTTIDLPPVAQITLSDTDGQIPLSIFCSGAASTDPEGGTLTYQWNFGDGTPEATGVEQNHTFQVLGQVPVRLTVTDPGGQAHSTHKIITLRNSEEYFPCQSSFTLLKTADCQGGTGTIRLNNLNAVYSLTNATGQAFTLSGNTYNNLPAGVYSFHAQGTNGCQDNFNLFVPVDSTSCPGWQQEICHMGIGTNMSGFADWVPERPLKNLMKHVRADLIAFDDPCFCWSNGNADLIQTDADGYPIQIPQLLNGVANKVRYVISSEGANLPPGHSYVLLYDGVGELTVQGGAVETSKTPGRIQFDVNVAENLFFRIDYSDANNHVRNIRVLRLEDEFDNLETQPFYEGFLDKIQPFEALRFMDWGATNSNNSVSWLERTSLTHFTYATSQGVPYEMMIQLANQTHKDVWICIPHAADSAFITELASLFKSQLSPDLTIYLEYSNEVWNWIFPQAHYNVNTAPANLNYGRAMAEKALKTFMIWHQVFDTQKSRVKRVLGLQAGYNDLNEQILSQLKNEDWDYGSPTSYLGLDHSVSGNPMLSGASTPEDVVANARNAWHTFIPTLRQDYNNIKLFGKEIINYEGGQHFVGNVFGIGYPYQQAMYDAQYTPEIYQLYNDMLDTIRNWGSRLFGNFSLASRQESIYGSWGVLNDIDTPAPYLQTAPKYQALLDNLCAEPSSNLGDPVEHHHSFSIVPNPSSGLVQILFKAKSTSSNLLLVLNSQGATLINKSIEQVNGQNMLQLDLSQLPAGIYQVVMPGIGAETLIKN